MFSFALTIYVPRVSNGIIKSIIRISKVFYDAKFPYEFGYYESRPGFEEK
jgi:hypothetical protein